MEPLPYPSISTERHRAAAVTLTHCNIQNSGNSDNHDDQEEEAVCVVVVGGQDADNNILDTCEKYDIGLMSWSHRFIPPMTTPRFGCGAVGDCDTIYVLGGQGANDEVLSTVEAWTYGQDNWTIIPTTTSPSSSSLSQENCERCFFGSVFLPGMDLIVVIGGRDKRGSILSSVVALNIHNHTWTTLTQLSTPRMACSVVRTGPSEILVMGGFDGKQYLNTTELIVLDDSNSEQPNQRRWLCHSWPHSMPTACGFSSAVTATSPPQDHDHHHGNQQAQQKCYVLVIGGINESKKLREVQVCDLSSKRWISIADRLPNGQGGASVAQFSDTALLIGGAQGPGIVLTPIETCLGLYFDQFVFDEFDTVMRKTHGANFEHDGDHGGEESPHQGGGGGGSGGAVTVVPVAVPVNMHENDGIEEVSVHTSTNGDSPSVGSNTFVVTEVQSVQGFSYEKDGQLGWYTGSVDSQNRPHGQGSIRYDSSRMTYDGDWWHGVKEGMGKSVKAGNSEVYEGLFHQDERCGRGTLQWDDGRRFEGFFRAGAMCGRGRLVLKDGKTVYEGELTERFVPQGVGKMTLPNRSEYEGMFQNGKFHGYGVFKHSNGMTYSGEFRNHKFNGFGRQTTQDGVLAKAGQFRNGRFTGQD